MSNTNLSLFYGADEFYMRWKLHWTICQKSVCLRAWGSGSWQVRMAVERVQFRGDIKNHKNIGCYTLSIRNKLHGKWILCAHKLLSSSPISFQGLEHFLFRDQPPNTYAADSKLFIHTSMSILVSVQGSFAEDVLDIRFFIPFLSILLKILLISFCLILHLIHPLLCIPWPTVRTFLPPETSYLHFPRKMEL
jgi:hypothetical protein